MSLAWIQRHKGSAQKEEMDYSCKKGPLRSDLLPIFMKLGAGTKYVTCEVWQRGRNRTATVIRRKGIQTGAQTTNM